MLDILQKYSGLLIYPFVALFLSFFLTLICIRVLPVLGYVDKPGGRHIHKRLVPRGGGIAVIVAFFVALGLFTISIAPDSLAAVTHEASPQIPLFWRLFWPASLLGALGMIDDRWELKSWLKLAVQLIVVLIIWFTGNYEYTIFGWTLPWFLSLPLTMGWIIIIINAFNLIDGLDGLASGLSIVSACCLAIWFLIVGNHIAEAVAMLVLAGACLGFLRHNFHPAKIFLGDTGSTFLGLMFAIIGLSTIDRAVTVTSLLLPMLAVGVPLFDVGLAIWRRSTRRLLNPEAGGIMDGDQDHLHHRLLRQTKKQTTTAIYMYLLACGFSGAALLVILCKDSVPAIAYAVLLLAVLIAIRQLAGVELFDSALLIQHGLAQPKRGLLVNFVHPFIDFALVSLSFAIVCWIILGSVEDFQLFVFALAPLALLLCVTGTYRVYWLRAGLPNYRQLLITVLLGSIASCLLIYLRKYDELVLFYGIGIRNFLAGCLLFTLLNLCFICLERLIVHYAEAFWFRVLYLQNKAVQERLCRTLIYGGGLKCRLYINYLYCANKTQKDEEEIIGIMDDDAALQKLSVYGFRVLGRFEQLEQIWLKNSFDKIVIATNEIPDETLTKLALFCDRHSIRLCRFQFGEEQLGGAVPEGENSAGAFLPEACERGR